MNICYLIDVSPERFSGGGQAHLTNLVRELKRSDLEYSRSDLIIFAGPSPIILIRLLWSFWVMLQVIFYHFLRRRFDLIHAHSIPAIVSGKILSVILGIPVVVTVHGYNGKRWMEKFILTKIRYDAQITVAREFFFGSKFYKKNSLIP